jgi:hypothetical protein
VLLLSLKAPYPLLDASEMFLAVGLLFFIVAPILAFAPKEPGVTPHYTLLALCPWVLVALVFSNGLFDRSAEIPHQTVVIGQNFHGNYDAVTVRSWRPGHSTEGLYLRTSWKGRRARWQLFGSGDYYFYGQFLSDGQPVLVGVRSGALGLPWISRISQAPKDFHFPMIQ